MEISDIIHDRLSITVDKLETQRPGIVLRFIEESKAELNYDAEDTLEELKKIHIGLHAALKTARAALDIYQEDLSEEQADDVRRQYQDRIKFLQEKIAQLQQEFTSVDVQLKGDIEATPPCFDIEKAGDSDD